MTGEVVTFDFESRAVRSLLDDEGRPWFVLSDICRVLEIGNPSDAARRLDDDERDTLVNNEGITGPQVQTLTIINESGLYSLILTSRKPEAKRFKKWVTAEVLPTLRRTGRYVMPGQAAAAAEAPLADELQGSLASLREVRRTWGLRAAREIWHSLPGLPQIPEHLRGGVGLPRQRQAERAVLQETFGSMDSIAAWWLARLRAGRVVEGGEDWPAWMASARLYADYRLHAERWQQRPASDAHFGSTLRRLLPGTFRRKAPDAAARRVWGYDLPPLDEARRHFEGLVGQPLDWRPEEWAPPDPVAEAFMREDALARFLAEATERDAAARVQARRLYLAYCSWCADDALEPLSETAFGRRMAEREVRQVKLGSRWWVGLRLRSGFGPGESEEAGAA